VRTSFDPQVSLCCRDGGFLTWAAKPSVRESPDPANDVALFLTSHLCTGRLPTPDTTQSPRWKFPDRGLRSHFFGRCMLLSGSKKVVSFHSSERHNRQVFCEYCNGTSHAWTVSKPLTLTLGWNHICEPYFCEPYLRMQEDAFDIFREPAARRCRIIRCHYLLCVFALELFANVPAQGGASMRTDQ